MVVKTRLNESILAGLKRARTNKAVLLFSGGVDSTAAGINLLGQGYEVYPLFVDYGQRAASAEWYTVNRLSPLLGFKKPLSINQQSVAEFPTQLTSCGDDKVVTDNQAWVPGRNTLFLVLAGIYAAHLDADGVCLGYCLEDNFVFGDNDLVHHQLIGVLLTRSLERPVEMLMPLAAMNKSALISLLREREVLDQTVSCWNAVLTDLTIQVCGQCANCIERAAALAGVNSE